MENNILPHSFQWFNQSVVKIGLLCNNLFTRMHKVPFSYSIGILAWLFLKKSSRYGRCLHLRLCNAKSETFLAPLAVGQRAYVMVRCPSCVRPSVRALTFSLNIFFAETTYRILMKFHRNVPTMVLFRIS